MSNDEAGPDNPIKQSVCPAAHRVCQVHLRQA
jgi:hypothetical protein